MAYTKAAVRDRRGSAQLRGSRRLWLVVLAVGLVAIIGGAALILGPLLGVWHRGQNDVNALQGWSQGSNALAHPLPGGATDAGKASCGSSSASDYALITFNDPAPYKYAGVAGDGTWDLLSNRSMVHYHGTPDPGAQGNVIIAFHREPGYEHIDQLNVGGMVTVQDRACHSFLYKVSGRWDIPPGQVTQLAPTTGYDLTLVTCDPWWQDYNRLVWRLSLVQPQPGALGSSGSHGGSVANPSF
jgi:LPXTG-site transpeptidase (sortase) family protein